jgi:16S rRNA (guanine527-N7)-methyltransferase
MSPTPSDGVAAAENPPAKIGPEAHSAVPHIDRAEFVRLSGATGAQITALETYLELLTDWNQRMNLVGPATLPDFWGRHAWDSAQLISLAPDALTWADLGAGAGLPGIVLAILGKDRDGFEVHLVESMAKRCRFLETVVETLDLPATVHNDRAENLSWDVDIVTARACAPMTRLLGYARPWMTGHAEGLFLKGQDVAAEIETARQSWRFEAELLPSTSDPRGRIVRLRNKIHARRS